MTRTAKFPRRSSRPLGAPGEVVLSDLGPFRPNDTRMVPLAVVVDQAVGKIWLQYLHNAPAGEMARA